jgi:phage baseplate assembly protein V
MSFALAELNRRFENLIRVGTIAVVDEQQKRLRVKSGDLITNWLPWPAHIGNNFIQWRPLRLNTQVVLCCPSGDPAQAMIIGMLYSDTQSSPDQDPAVDRIQFEDGTVVQYNANQKTLTLSRKH